MDRADSSRDSALADGVAYGMAVADQAHHQGVVADIGGHL